MILVMGHIKFAAGERARVASFLADHMKAVVQEEGCDHYSFSFDAGNPDLVHITERWADEAALAAHGTAPHQKGFGRALREFKLEAVRADAWTGEFWRNLVGG